MNKRILIPAVLIVILLVCGIAVSLFRGRDAGTAPSGAADVRLLCTTYPVYLFTKAVTEGTGIEPELLIPPGAGCPHDYALTPQDLMKLSGARFLLLKNGAGLDGAVCETIRRTAGPEHIADTLDCSAGIALIPAGEEDEHEEHGHAEHEHGPECHHHHHGGDFNAHVFASPDTAAQMVRNIADRLMKQYPSHAARFKTNAEAFLSKLDALADECRNAGFRGEAIAVQHNVFAYLARLCGLREAVSLHAEENQSPSPAVIAQLKKTILAEKVRVLFSEPQYPPDFAELLAKETGIRHAVLDPCASGPADAGADHYIGVMRRNLETLKKQLEK